MKNKHLCLTMQYFMSYLILKMKFYERWLQPLLFLCPLQLRCSLTRSRETCFARPNRRACSQAKTQPGR